MKILTASEQIADHLRQEILAGRLRGEMSGSARFAKDWKIGHDTVDRALRQLEKEGYLLNQGRRRPRKVVPPEGRESSLLRIGFLPFEASDLGTDFMIRPHELLKAEGHSPFYAPQTLCDLKMNLVRVRRLVEKTRADAWVVTGATRPILEWFAAQSTPAFAMFGRRHSVEIASCGPETVSVISTIVKRLVALGHRRIILITREHRRIPEPAPLERAFLAELKAQGLPVGPYNLPDWVESNPGLHQLLDSLFRVTPPTAMIIDEPQIYVAILRYFAEHGIRTPRDVSLVCTDPDRSFAWCEPPISHITWDFDRVTQRVRQWASNITRNRDDREQTDIPSEFIEDGTVGPAAR